jgi:KipI family sensor histidine kinase inhibitor
VSRYGDAALLVEYEAVIDAHVNARVQAAAEELRRQALPGVRDIVPAIASLAIHVDPLSGSLEAVAAAVASVVSSSEDAIASPAGNEIHEIPICYGGPFGPDLDAVAAWASCSTEEVAALHSAATYRVYMLGFLPGFAYLGRVEPRIAMPRHASPRLRVHAGSVGIAGEQTGIYPRESPGGWQIIGRTPLVLFDVHRTPPARLRPGSAVRFVSIPASEFSREGDRTASWA